MPTGYTAKISKGQSFNDFVMGCARGFGACVGMRDLPQDAEIPAEFKPSNYHHEQAQGARKELDQLRALTPDEIEELCLKRHQAAVAENKKYGEEKRLIHSRYIEMLNKIHEWDPPGVDHIQLKEFMIAQINTSIQYDCSVSLGVTHKQSPEEWHKEQTGLLIKRIQYHIEKHLAEIKRVETANKWIRELRESLAECEASE